VIYEIRMTIVFYLGRDGMKKVKSTIIEYIGAKDISSAYLKAGELKHDIMTAIGKTMIDCNEMSISLDAVVAKPEMSPKQIVKRTRIMDYFVDKDKAQLECRLNNGSTIVFTEDGLNGLLDMLRDA